MHAALADCDQPRTALNWIRNARSAHLLAELVASGRPLTHAALDAMADGAGRGGAAAVDYLRGVLVTYGVLPERDELGPRIERHLARVVARHREHALLLRPYVRWSLLPRARGRPALAGGSRHRIRWAYTRINTAAAFLAFTTERGLTLADADQEDVDAWLVANPGTGYEVRDFVVWAARRGHSRPLVVPHRGKADPVGLDQDSAWELLHQCLTDADLPLDVRAAGAILLLFGQHLSRIAALPADAVTAVEAMPDARTEHAAAIVLDHVPILLPEPLARVLAGLAAQPPPSGWAANSPRRWLFPGSRAGTHASATVLSRRLAAHGIPVRPARTAALVHLAEDLPPAVLGPMLGMHIVTAVHWRRRANTDWTSYLQARAIACEDDRDRAGSDARPRS
ncbi:hypothetical protein OG216_47620 (plasmid) [Streptomycetaceae bacterium NBC_01309]